MQKQPSTKPGTPAMLPSKAVINSWLKSLFPDLPINLKIEDFGDGVIYCRLINHFYGNISQSKITWAPKNQYQYANNLRHVQTALLQLDITIPFDVNRVAKKKFLQNWTLINAFYKHITTSQQLLHQQSSISSHGNQLNLPTINPMHLISHQITHQNANVPTQVQKNLKRPQSIGFEHPQFDPKLTVRTIAPLSYHNFPHQQARWDHNIANFSSLANSSLQMSQYLKQNINLYNSSSPSKGKWSVGSQMFQNNHNAIVDRVKQILLKESHDTQKVRQIKMLLGMPVEQQQVIKIQDDDGVGPIVHSLPQIKKQEVKHEIIQQKYMKQLPQVTHKQFTSSKQQLHKLSVSKTPCKKPFKI